MKRKRRTTAVSMTPRIRRFSREIEVSSLLEPGTSTIIKLSRESYRELQADIAKADRRMDAFVKSRVSALEESRFGRVG